MMMIMMCDSISIPIRLSRDIHHMHQHISIAQI
jgi:hypothetical protein